MALGMLAALALRMVVLRRGFMSGSPPPCRAVMVSSLMILVNAWPRLASAMPFLCLIVCHLLWPDMLPLLLSQFRRSYHEAERGVNTRAVSRPGNSELAHPFRRHGVHGHGHQV